MDYTKQIQLDVNAYGELPVVYVKQGDASARYIVAELLKDGEAYEPESGITYLFRCEKPDGRAVIIDSSFLDDELQRYLIIKNSDNTVSIELVAQTMTTCGRCKCDLCLMKNGAALSTIPFILDVKPSPNVATLAVSSDDFRTLQNAIKQAEELIEGVAQSLGTLTLPANWTGSGTYTQNVSITGYNVTGKTKIDLVGNQTAVNTMMESGAWSIFIQNDNGSLVAYAVGGKPTKAITVQASLYETIEI